MSRYVLFNLLYFDGKWGILQFFKASIRPPISSLSPPLCLTATSRGWRKVHWRDRCNSGNYSNVLDIRKNYCISLGRYTMYIFYLYMSKGYVKNKEITVHICKVSVSNHLVYYTSKWPHVTRHRISPLTALVFQ